MGLSQGLLVSHRLMKGKHEKIFSETTSPSWAWANGELLWLFDVRRSSSVVCHVWSVVINYFKGHLLLNYWLNLDKLGRNDPYLTLLNNCSNGSSPLHILIIQAKNKFSKWNLEKSSCLKQQGLELWYLICIYIVSEYDQKIHQIQTANNLVAPQGRAAQPSRDTR